jgi:gliding motility-associated-like protein|tara:strand:+ start:257 stop:1276 length:1020 start_codon:yes stop_codon:yes gene_type:complete
LLNFKNIQLCVQFPRNWEYKTFIYIFLLLIISTSNSNAQNLVFNGDFEIYDTCPTAVSTPGDMQIQRCIGWYSPTAATSDYYNACGTGFVSVPTNVLGYQPAFSGNGYLGLIPVHNAENDYGFWFEYAQTKLVKQLLPNQKYEFSFHINVANFSNDYSLRSFGAYFSSNPINRNDFKPFQNLIPQVSYSANSFITDTVNWIKISGEFIANGGEEYLTLGMFADTTNFDTLCNYTFPCDFNDFSTYYYIDYIELIEAEMEIIIPNIITPNNDGRNDIFQLNFPFLKAEIYNRWGQRLFESKNDAFWDGRTTSGAEAPEGTYYYIITTKEETHKGFIQLLR